MKKLIFILPFAAMLLAGCGGERAPESSSTSPSGGDSSHSTGLTSDTSGGESSHDTGATTGDDISTGYGFVLGGHAYALSNNVDDGQQQGRTGRYLVEDLDLVADTEFYFTNNGELITKIGGHGDDKTGGIYNNWKYGTEKGKFKVGATLSAATFEFNTWQDGGYSFWSPTTTQVDHGTEPGGGGGDPTGETGFGIIRAASLADATNPTFVHGVEDGEDPDHRQQWKIADQTFEVGNVFAAWDFKNSSRWTPPLQNGSPEYVTIDTEHSVYVVEKAFTATLYLKTAWENDALYIAFAS